MNHQKELLRSLWVGFRDLHQNLSLGFQSLGVMQLRATDLSSPSLGMREGIEDSPKGS